MSKAIRVGFIGLNAKECWAVSAHLPYFKQTSKYRIVALLNSSEESAKAAIESHGLDAETKAYGSGEAFARDSNIDMIVCSVRVDKHHPVLMPILKETNAKLVHCEWPLGKNLQEAEELTALAKSKDMKTVVGLQGRMAPSSRIVKKLIDEGKIGRPLSVTVTAIGYNFGAEDLHTLSYTSDISFGGNMVTIHFSHTMDTINHAVGQFASYSALLETKREKTLLRNKGLTYKPSGPDDEAVKIIGEVKRTSHDQIMVQGHLDNGALLTFHMRGGLPFPGVPGIEWRVYGEKGEIRVTTPSMNLSLAGPGHTVQVHVHGEEQAADVELPQDEYDRAELPWPARGPSRVYDAFARGDETLYANWENALQRHRLVEELYAHARGGGMEEKAQYMHG